MFFFSVFFSFAWVCVCVCCAVQEASALSATTHSGTSSQLGLTERGCSQRKRREDSCYPSTLTIPAASGGGRQTCTSLHTLVHLLPLTWPSRPPRGRQPWEKLRAPVWRPLLRMRKPKQPIWTLLQHVGGKGLNFSPSGRKYWRLGAESCRFPPQDLQRCSCP